MIEFEYSQEGLKHLAIAVILRAIRDYHHGDKDARSFLKSDRLDYWCKFAGLAAEVVRQKAFVRKMIPSTRTRGLPYAKGKRSSLIASLL